MADRVSAGQGETPRAYHVIADLDLVGLLRRAHAGEDPDLLYIEAYVNAEREDVCDEDW